MVSNSRKNASNKSMLFPVGRKLVSTSWNEGFVEKYVSLDVKVNFGSSDVCKKNKIEWF